MRLLVVNAFTRLLLLALLLQSRGLRAEGEKELVQSAQARIAKASNEGEVTANVIDEVSDTLLDYDAIAFQVFGDKWSLAKSADRDQLTAAVKALILTEYAPQLAMLPGLSMAGNVRSKTALTVVLADASHAKSSVAFRFARTGSDEAPRRAFDILIDGVSLVFMYRDQFEKVLRTRGLRATLQRLGARTSELASAAVSRAEPPPTAAKP